MTDLSGCVRAAEGGTTLEVEVVPGASRSLFPAGFNPWRGRLEARVQAPPEKGQANAELEALVARFFALPPARVRVTAGHTARRKTLHLAGLAPEAAVAALRSALP